MVGTVGLLHHHRTAVVDDAVAQAHARRQRAAFVQVLVDRVAPGEDDAGDQDLVAHLERADLVFGEGKGERNHEQSGADIPV